ncbi:DNA/RNA helicase [Canibacter zhoujuaniae]|uniref:DNA/RNA helicase n=1 Tax=Canibacter zhoujuaniae TaxID=2708343 RepID=UPI0014246C33|nr:DNA/RNA helicase [Canibacter zhoujuaniae]
MSLSRKRRRELKKLNKLANGLLQEQREVLGHAGVVLAEAGHQARKLGNEHLLPRVEGAYNSVRPAVETGVGAVRSVWNRFTKAATPVAASALSKTVNALEQAEQKELADRLARLGVKSGLIKRKRRVVGGIFAAVAGAAAVAAVGYTLFQAFRDDEEVWVAPESDEASN